MNNKTCAMCGASMDANAEVCPTCGFQQSQQPQAYQMGAQQPVQQQPVQQQPVPQPVQPAQQQMMYDPNTGQPLQPQIQVSTMNNGMAVLEIVRPSSFFGVAANMMVSLDGENSQQLSNNQTVTYNLTPGQHVISYKVWCRRKKEYTLVAVAGKTYRMVFTPDWLWGGFKINNNLSTLQ